MKSIYQILEVCMDIDQNYVIQYVGEVAEQGGFTFSHGTAILKNTTAVVSFVKSILENNEAEYKRRLEAKKWEYTE